MAIGLAVGSELCRNLGRRRCGRDRIGDWRYDYVGRYTNQSQMQRIAASTGRDRGRMQRVDNIKHFICRHAGKIM
jgi:hypothetical protein